MGRDKGLRKALNITVVLASTMIIWELNPTAAPLKILYIDLRKTIEFFP